MGPSGTLDGGEDKDLNLTIDGINRVRDGVEVKAMTASKLPVLWFRSVALMS